MKGSLVHMAEAQRSHQQTPRKGNEQTWRMGSGPPALSRFSVRRLLITFLLTTGDSVAWCRQGCCQDGCCAGGEGGKSRLCKLRRNQTHQTKRPCCWDFVTINSSERVKITETLIADVYLPFLTCKMETVVWPHRDHMWFKGPALCTYMILDHYQWPEWKAYSLVSMTNVI